MFFELRDAKTLQKIGANVEQKEKLRDLRVATSRRDQQAVFDKAEQWPNIFSPKQQAKLREEGSNVALMKRSRREKQGNSPRSWRVG